MSLLPISIRPHGLLLSSDARDEGWDGGLRAAIRREEVTKVRPGVYIAGERWRGLTPEQQYLTRVQAVALTFRDPVFALQSAAALHRLPLLRTRLARLHLAQTTPRGSGRRGDVTVHALGGDPDLVIREGMRLTSATRTVLDLARSLPHAEALAVVDAAVRPRDSGGGIQGAGAALCSPLQLRESLRTSDLRRHTWAAHLVVTEADPRAGSMGESMARSLFLRLGAPRPELQLPLWDRDGFIGYADFGWPDCSVVGEFDGRLKYGADNPSGRRPEDVVYREKVREDRIRRVTSGFFRIGWNDLGDPARVAALLSQAGVPLERSRAWPAMRQHVIGSSVRTRLSR